MDNTIFLKVIPFWLLTANAILFFLMRFDKQQARKRKQRIPEKTLLMLGLMGGAIGGLFGMSVFRHKTRHTHFYPVFILGIGIWGWILYIIL